MAVMRGVALIWNRRKINIHRETRDLPHDV
jgi:hypothetical protein